MEYSISGHRNGKMVKGIRPTLNAYMCAEAIAIAYFADKLGQGSIAEEYISKARELRHLMNEALVFDGFYKAKHGECDEEILSVLEKDTDTGSPMELIGYVPFMFGLAPDGLETAFYHLDDSRVFLASVGMATADMRHPDFLKEYNHECLWNGYVWPFATSQVLTGLIKTIHRGHAELKPIFIKHLDLYSKMHRIELDGRVVPWIDEVMSPTERVWTSRAILEGLGWQENLGGRERGKDYNHSTFCDLVICGIVGVKTDSEELILDPAIPDDWDYMRLDNLEYRGRLYTVIYDKSGEKYGQGKGLFVIECENTTQRKG